MPMTYVTRLNFVCGEGSAGILAGGLQSRKSFGDQHREGHGFSRAKNAKICAGFSLGSTPRYSRSRNLFDEKPTFLWTSFSDLLL
jgi:hypothetical protein